MASSNAAGLLKPSSTNLIEEETLHDYRPGKYYPVELQQLFKRRYRVVSKLGYGSASTVWLCRDQLRNEEYVALKVYTCSPGTQRELPAYNHINSLQSKNIGKDRVRRMLDDFEVDGEEGKHVCLVHEAMGPTFAELRSLTLCGTLDAGLLRELFRHIIRGLQFLHEEANIIHTDLQPNNMFLGVHDKSYLAALEEAEEIDPLPRKITGNRTIYGSRAMRLTRGPPSIGDLSEARFGSTSHKGLIMPDPYRAPEVILGMPWSYPVDIWGLAMTLWDLFEPKRLFRGRDADGHYSAGHHLAEMCAILGPPPLDFLERSPKSRDYWDERGRWIGSIEIPDLSLETAEQNLENGHKELFLNYMRKMLRWRPEDRCGWDDLFWDEWLLADLLASGEVVRDE